MKCQSEIFSAFSRNYMVCDKIKMSKLKFLRNYYIGRLLSPLTKQNVRSILMEGSVWLTPNCLLWKLEILIYKLESACSVSTVNEFYKTGDSKSG